MKKILFFLLIIGCQYKDNNLLRPITGTSNLTYSINTSAIRQDVIKVIDRDLHRVNLFTDDFSVETSEGEIDFIPGVYYQGENCVVSIIDGELEGVYDQMYISSRSNVATMNYMNDTVTFECHTPNYTPSDIEQFKQYAQSFIGTSAVKEVSLYWELRYDLVNKKGGVTNAVNWITGIFNVVQYLYKKEGINLRLSGIYAWDKPDNYAASGTSTVLGQYITKIRTDQRANLHHLIGMPDKVSGGIAYVNVLCNKTYNGAFSEIQQNYSNNSYSWTINVLVHETGHNLASPHTHACTWPGGPIDGCAPTVNPAYAEGNCATGPIPTKGTYMSYCHLLPNVGIGWEIGFGPLPKNLLLNTITSASCLNTIEDTVVVVPGLPELCTYTNNNKYEYITSVKIAGKTFETGINPNGYYSSNDTIFAPQTFEVGITTAWKSTVYNEGYGVFIDLNKDGKFTSGESITLPPNKNVLNTINLNQIAPGTYRIRVAVEYNNVPNGCSGKYGEAEDFIIKITSSPQTCKDPVIVSMVPKTGDYVANNFSADVLNAEKVIFYVNGSVLSTLVSQPYAVTLPDKLVSSVEVRAYGCGKVVSSSKKLRWE